MSDIIFARPRFEYASYADLYQLIDLSGFEWVYIDQIDPQSENVYIITILNGEIPPDGYPGARARIVLYDLEYHLDNPPHIPGVEIWAADKWYAEQIGAKYVPMGSHAGLKLDTPYRYSSGFDVAYIGFIAGLHRREVIRQQLIERGVEVSPIVAWGAERDVVLRQSKAYLQVHQHAHIPTIAPLRMVVAAAYSLPVITETCADAGVFNNCILCLDYADIADNVHAWTKDTYPQKDWFANALRLNAAQLHRLLCEELTFRKSVEGAL